MEAKEGIFLFSEVLTYKSTRDERHMIIVELRPDAESTKNYRCFPTIASTNTSIEFHPLHIKEQGVPKMIEWSKKKTQKGVVWFEESKVSNSHQEVSQIRLEAY